MGFLERFNRRPGDIKLTGAHSNERAMETPQASAKRKAEEKANGMTTEQYAAMMAEAHGERGATGTSVNNMAEAAVAASNQRIEMRTPVERAKNPENLPELPKELETMGRASIGEWANWDITKIPLLGADKERKAAAAIYVKAHPDLFSEQIEGSPGEMLRKDEEAA